MIDTAVFLTLKTKTEIHVVALLASVLRPLRLSEIIKALQEYGHKANKENCSNTLKRLAEQGIIRQYEEFGSTLYASTSDKPTFRSEIPPSRSDKPPFMAENPPLRSDKPPFIAENPPLRSEIPPESAPFSSPFHGESVVNMLTCVNTTNTTNKKDSEISLETQASAETPPGKAGSADEAELIPPASTAPADSPHRTSAAAKTRSAGGTANTPKKPPKIDATAYADQTRQILPEHPTAAQVPVEVLPAEPTDRSLFRIVPPAKAENCPGTVFLPGMNPTKVLYQMFKNIQGKMVPDPDAEIVIKHLPDAIKPRTMPMIPAEEAFGKYVRILWELIQRAEEQGGKKAIETWDTIIHRAAYLYVEDLWDEVPQYHDWRLPENFISMALKRSRNCNFGTHLMGMLSEIYPQLGLGWNTEQLYNKLTWSAELARFSLEHARKDLFRSFFHNQASTTRLGKELARKTATDKKAVLFAATVKPLLQEHRDAAERQTRIDAAHRSDDPGEAVLARIAEKIGEKRFDLWFGREAKVDVAEKELVFSVHNSFAVNSIRQHCTAELDETMRELGYVNKNGSLWKRRMKPLKSQEPQMSREQEIAQAMSSAAAINAEARERKKSNRPMTIGQLGKKIAQNK